jgi:hypothetical protein
MERHIGGRDISDGNEVVKGFLTGSYMDAEGGRKAG